MPSGFDVSPLVTPTVADSPGCIIRQLVPTPLPGTMHRNQARPLQRFQDILRCDLLSRIWLGGRAGWGMSSLPGEQYTLVPIR